MARLGEELADSRLEALLASDPVSVRYLTGAWLERAACLVGPDVRLAAVRRMEGAAAREGLRAHGFEVIEAATPARALVERAAGRVGFEDGRMTVREFRALESRGECELVAVGALLDDLRAVKDAVELEALRAAARMSDAVLEWLAEGPLAGRSELELVSALEARMRELGSEGPAFETHVLAGPRGAAPHGDPTDALIEPGEPVVVDLGCVVDGYRSDCTRVFAAGPAGEEVESVYAAVADAQESAIAALEPGTATKAVDAAARDVLTEAGYGDEFVHGVGHGVGLEIHEAPMLLTSSEGSVREGNVVTIEPAVYLPERFGIRLEDTVHLGPGGPERLTRFTRELVVL